VSAPWRLVERFATLRTRWFALLGEYLETEHGEVLEYWRVERADSVIVMPLANGSLWLPPPVYRPGVGTATLDFPGGRIATDCTPAEAATGVLARELGVEAGDIVTLAALNEEGWLINSSFSNQRLFAFVAELGATARPRLRGVEFPANASGIAALTEQLQCLQCRAVLHEWQRRARGSEAGREHGPATGKS
jgi:hypothetical protein